MALESLLELVKTLSKRIEEHGELLRKNEALTRTALIDPLLRELGWNIEDPAQVIPEFPTDNNEKPDYVLFTSAGPTMVVEAKSLNSPLHEKEKAYKKSPTIQALNYSYNIRETNYFSVTDGRYWEIYDKQRLGDKNKGRISQFDITGSPAEVCLKALVLWRPGVEAGIVSSSQSPIIQHRPSADTPTPVPRGHTPPAPAPDTDSAWIPYSRFQYESGKGLRAELKFPDGKNVRIQKGSEVITETVQWLFREGHLKPNHCPIQRGTRYILATEPTHPPPSKKPFKRGNSIGPFHVETDYSIEYNIKNACKIIELTKQELAQFKIRRSS